MASEEGISVDTVANVDVNIVEQYQGKIIGRDQRLWVGRWYKAGITRPWKHHVQLCHYTYLFFTLVLLLVSIALTVANTFAACLFDFGVGWINPRSFGTMLTLRRPGHSGSSMLFPGSISDSASMAQSSSLSYGLSKSPCQLSQSSVSEMLSGEQYSLLSTAWRLTLQIQRTCNIWVHSPGRFFADKGSGKQDLCDNLNAATPSCWMSDQDALMISSVSEMYPTAVICLFWARDFFCVARRFWLPCHISNKSWTLAILCNFFSSTYFIISVLFSVFFISNSGQVPAKIPLLARGNCLTNMFSWMVMPVVFNCLQLTTSRPKEKLTSTMSPCCMIQNMSYATLERSAYFEFVSSCCRHQSVMSSL